MLVDLANQPQPYEVYKSAPPTPPADPIDSLPLKVVIFDIDGTLSDTSKRQRHLEKEPKDWKSFFAELGEDEPHEHIADLAYLIHNKHPDWMVVLATGRDESWRPATEAWLEKHSIPYTMLYMRRENDRRDDSVVKLEMLDWMREDGFEPVMAFEDRKRVVDAWRKAGIPCLQVAEGNF